MPAIRDFTTNYTTSTTGTTIVIDAPVCIQNDLLLAVLCADTNNTGYTWSLSGWLSIVNQSNATNGTQLTILYKIAGASEPANYTFTRTGAETFNGGVIAIRDVNTSYPFGNPTITSATTQAAASRYAVTSVTTNVTNSLILYASSCASQTGSPTFVEGPVNYLYTVQGTAESSGVGWGFQAAQGATPAVYCATPTTGTGVKATLQIAAPSGGATVIPPYGPADASVYLDPIDGITAYNSNIGFAATATSYFGTALGGLTLATAAAAVADSGLNPTHSVGSITTTAANNWTGATMVLAAAKDVTGKNIIVHTGPPAPVNYQRLTSAAAGKGIAFGMATSNGNYKIWQTHGAGTSFVHSRDVPLVINTGNTTGVIGSAGTLTTTSVLVFGFFLASQSTTAIYQFYSLWVLDTMTIAGGNAAEPVGVDGIVKVIQGHEHRGAMIQGSGELLLFMPVQIGNGGTDPTYLDINNSAIEFPTQYNQDLKKINYCSTDNVAGLKYYAGATDTIKHRDSVISSASRYFWGLHASSSTSATYDFSGLAVIGAGTITLANAITITGLTINNYSTIDASSLTLNSGTIVNVPAGNDTLTTSTATLIEYSSINVTGVTAGNRWCTVTTPVRFENNTFTGSASTGHAIRITSPGTYSFIGNVFNSFGATGSNSAAIFNDSAGVVTLNISGTTNLPTYRNGTNASTSVLLTTNLTINIVDANGAAITASSQSFTVNAGSNVITSAGHGLSNGNIIYFTSTTTLPAGLSLNTTYFVINQATDTFKVSTVSGGSEVDITDTGTGTHTWYSGSPVEITIVRVSGEAVLFQEDNVIDGTITYQFTSGAGDPVYINVHNVAGYQNKTAYMNLPAAGSDTTTIIQLDEDRFYQNP